MSVTPEEQSAEESQEQPRLSPEEAAELKILIAESRQREAESGGAPWPPYEGDGR
jgi:hypothetical protein